MKKIGIMTDSHSGIPREEADRLGIRVLPMPFYMEGETYYEGVDISSEEFYEKLRSGVNVSTSQQSPQQIMDMWDEMLKEYEKDIRIFCGFELEYYPDFHKEEMAFLRQYRPTPTITPKNTNSIDSLMNISTEMRSFLDYSPV